MAMNDLFSVAGSKPKLITAYTSGTGTYVPTENNARCLVRLQGGGGGGHATGSGGGGGAMIEFIIRIPIAGLAYAVGAGGAVANNGSNSTFGPYTAIGGGYDSSGTNQLMYGGITAIGMGGVDADSVTFIGSTGITGVPGGMGGNAANAGMQAGFPIGSGSALLVGASNISTLVGRAGNGQGNNSGGNSFYGKGGTTGNAPASDAYGAGGGMNAAGRGGYIEIWDFGA
jgi:hypothetical protein